MRRFFNFIKNLLILAIMAAAVVNYHEQIQTFLLEAAGTASTYLEQKGLKSKTLDLSGGIVAESNEKVTKNTTGYLPEKEVSSASLINMRQKTEIIMPLLKLSA